MKPLERVTLLMTLMRQLQDVLDRENTILKGLRLERLYELQREKAGLLQAYEAELRRLRAEPAVMGGVDPEVRACLDQAMRDLQRAVRTNSIVKGRSRRILLCLVEQLGHSLGNLEPAMRRYLGEATSGSVVPMVAERSL